MNMKQHMSRPRFVIGCILVLAGLLGWQFLKLPSDDEMLATFRANRDVFDQLVQMYIADDQDMWISTRGVYWVGHSTSVGVPLNRRIQYVGLLWRAGVSSIGVGGVRDYSGPHRLVPFEVYAYLQLPEAPVKSFIYTTETLQLPVAESDTQNYTFPVDTLYEKVCRPLEEHWYLCLDYED